MSDAITTTTTNINDHTNEDFNNHRDWLVDTYFHDYILPSMMLFAEQMSAIAMQQMQIIGTFLDAKHELETQRLFQQLAAQANKDYYPSETMCSIGTATRSLAAAERNGELTTFVMAERSQDRQLMNVNSSAATGRKSDRASRTEQFKKTYCEKNDNDGGLVSICSGTPPVARRNKDIDFSRTLWQPMSLDVDFSDATKTDDEEDILALESNLYAHDTFKQPISETLLKKEGSQQVLLDMRAIVAKRSVAENSFQAIAGMKAKGADTSGTAQYLQAIAKQLNSSITDAQAKDIVGANPSYYAQMELLTKGLIEDPQFFTDLYDKPANVARKGVAMQAIALMQDRDYFKSNMRSEAILSVLLELEVAEAQEKVQDQITPLVNPSGSN